MTQKALSRLTLAEITAPLDPEQFFARHWTREAALLRQPGRIFDRYFGWDAITSILNAGDIAFPKIKVSRCDQPVPAEQFTVNVGGQRLVDGRAVLSLFQEGASFGITGADSHWVPLREVVDCLYDGLLESVHTNVYCSPANTQGFQCHFDLHEVFVLQVAGEKHWRVFPPTTEAPVSSWRAEDSPHRTTEPYLDVVLRRGDVLYVPRGHWHYAVAQDSSSLHVTVGITCRKGTSLIDWLTGQLLEEAAWRRNVPLLADTTRGGVFAAPSDWAAWSNDIRQSLTRKLADPELFDRFCRETLAGVELVHNATVIDDPWPVEGLRFQRPAGRRHYFAADSATLTVTVGGAEIQVDATDAGLLRKIFDADSFTLADVRAWKPGVALTEAAALLSELTRAGFLSAHRTSS